MSLAADLNPTAHLRRQRLGPGLEWLKSTSEFHVGVIGRGPLCRLEYNPPRSLRTTRAPLGPGNGKVCRICSRNIARSKLWGIEPTSLTARTDMPRTEIYKHGEDISVVTSASDERDFIDTFAEAIQPIMANGAPVKEKRDAVRAGFDILAKLRGYKTDVQERRILAAGRWPHPSEKPLAAAGADGEAQD